MKFDLSCPTDRQLRPSRSSGLVAVPIIILVLIAVVLVVGHPSRWWHIGGAIGCLVMAAVYAFFFMVTTRAVGALKESVDFRRAMAALNELFDEREASEAAHNANVIRDSLHRGLPIVTRIVPAERVVIFARPSERETFTSLDAWPDPDGDVDDLGGLPELSQVLKTDALCLVTSSTCFIPIGRGPEGGLVMVIDRNDEGRMPVDRVTEGCELIGASFRRVTSRANPVGGPQAQSRVDPLTGLANRQSLYERIEVEMAHAIRSESPLSLAMIDIDFFKRYNDRYGQVAGDMLLRSIAALMVSNIRAQDLAVRFGGEEFCLVLPDTDILGGHHLLEKLRSGGRDATSNYGITLSAGLTSWDGLEDATSLIERAGQALYRAKETGRDRVVSIQSFTEF